MTDPIAAGAADSLPPGLDFEQVVFSGGGTRCFWHGGFLEVVAHPLDLHPERVSAVSGGALAGACFIGRCEKKLFQVMGRKIDERRSNVSVDWDELQQNGLTPHQELYRETVEEVLDDGAIAKIADGPEFDVLLSHPPKNEVPELSTVPLMVAYEADLAIRSTPHIVWAHSLGADDTLVDARQAARDGKLHDLICNAAVIPPVFNVQGWDGRPVVDGGMTSKAPMPRNNSGRTLILLTRQFRNYPDEPDRLYVEPSEATAADKIDFTSFEKIEETWNQGRDDGEAFLSRHGLA